jgi:hypothetical protein
VLGSGVLLLTSGANPAQSYPVRHEYVWQSSPPHQSIATDNTVRSSTKALLDLRESGAIIETDADVVTLIERTYTTSPVTWQTTI